MMIEVGGVVDLNCETWRILFVVVDGWEKDCLSHNHDYFGGWWYSLFGDDENEIENENEMNDCPVVRMVWCHTHTALVWCGYYYWVNFDTCRVIACFHVWIGCW